VEIEYKFLRHFDHMSGSIPVKTLRRRYSWVIGGVIGEGGKVIGVKVDHWGSLGSNLTGLLPKSHKSNQ